MRLGTVNNLFLSGETPRLHLAMTEKRIDAIKTRWLMADDGLLHSSSTAPHFLQVANFGSALSAAVALLTASPGSSKRTSVA